MVCTPSSLHSPTMPRISVSSRGCAELAHQRAVQLDEVDGKAMQILQGGGAGAEIVEADFEAQLPHRLDRIVSGDDIGDFRRFRNFHQRRGASALFRASNPASSPNAAGDAIVRPEMLKATHDLPLSFLASVR